VTSELDTVPVADPRAGFLAREVEIRAAIDGVLTGGRYILGDNVAAFESEFAAFVGTEHCVTVASGTDAITLALRAVGLEPGDEVITVSHSAVATVAAIELAGGVPVFADIDPVSRCMSPGSFESRITERTKAVVPVHIYGQPADMTRITEIARKHGLSIVEDCAQAHGARIGDAFVGTFGDAAAFSFYPTKNLGALGDGGAVTTRSDAVAGAVKLLREYGWRERYVSSIAGTNSRLDEIQSAVLRVNLRALAQKLDRRREIAAEYSRSAPLGIDTPASVAETTHAMHLYVVECDQREDLRAHLRVAGIATAIHYPLAIHAQPAYSERLRGADDLPHTEALYSRIVTLPLFPEMTDEQVGRVCHALKEWRPAK